MEGNMKGGGKKQSGLLSYLNDKLLEVKHKIY